jgi:hypothetical protein
LQTPFLHISPTTQVLPQSPQFKRSSPNNSLHTPEQHVNATGQAFGHDPQCSLSVCVLTQSPEQHVSSAAQGLSHLPQCSWLFVTSIQVRMSSTKQQFAVVQQSPLQQIGVASGQTFPQPSQLLLSSYMFLQTLGTTSPSSGL